MATPAGPETPDLPPAGPGPRTSSQHLSESYFCIRACVCARGGLRHASEDWNPRGEGPICRVGRCSPIPQSALGKRQTLGKL